MHLIHKGLAHTRIFLEPRILEQTGPNPSEVSNGRWPCGRGPPVKRPTPLPRNIPVCASVSGPGDKEKVPVMLTKWLPEPPVRSNAKKMGLSAHRLLEGLVAPCRKTCRKKTMAFGRPSRDGPTLRRSTGADGSFSAFIF